MSLFYHIVDFFKNYPYSFLEFLSGLFLFIVSIKYYKNLLYYSKALFIYSIIIFPFELINNILSLYGSDNHFVYLYFYLIESILLCLYYYENIDFKSFGYVLTAIVIVMMTGIIYNIYNSTNLMNDYSGSLQSIGFIIIALVCYYNILSNGKIINLSKSTLFWVNTGNLIYFSGKFFIFLFILEVLSREKNELDGFWKIISLLLVLHRILLAVGIIQTKHAEINRR